MSWSGQHTGLSTLSLPDIGESNWGLSLNLFLDDLNAKALVLKSAQAQLSQTLIPPGVYVPFAGSSVTPPPDGWLLCDGREVPRGSYPNLWAAIGTLYGAGTVGADTFNLPNLVGRVPVGYDASGKVSEFSRFGASGVGGEMYHKLLPAEMPSHSHTATGGFSGSMLQDKGVNGGNVNMDFGGNNRLTGNATIGISVAATGNDQPHNNLQPYITTNYIIKY